VVRRETPSAPAGHAQANAAPSPSASASPGQTQTAALGDLLQVSFPSGSAELDGSGQQALARVVQKLEQRPDARLQLTAYAEGTPETESQARRLSLSRALAVRRYLSERGVSGGRIEVRALGSHVPDGSADRVDLRFLGS
jgi:outer membrane protein OmpA-like peptidoglycan-associated protein